MHLFVKTILVELNGIVTTPFTVSEFKRKKKSVDCNRRSEHCTAIIQKRLTRLNYHFNQQNIISGIIPKFPLNKIIFPNSTSFESFGSRIKQYLWDKTFFSKGFSLSLGSLAWLIKKMTCNLI